jgi:predicted dehydrogenase
LNKSEDIKPVKATISGCGGITPTILRGISDFPEIEIVAVQDIDGKAAESIASEFDIPRYTTEFGDILSDDVEMVIINTQNDCHRDQTIEALTAGKHCMVQKPIARTVKEGEEMVAAAKKAGLLLGVVMMERSDPIFRQMRSMVEAGCFGTVSVVRAGLAHTNHLKKPPPEDNWRCSPERIGGGSFIQLAIHHIDIAQFVMNQSIVEVTALSSSMVKPERFPVDETTGAVVRFADGAVGLFLSSFTSTADRIEFLGTEGMISRDDESVRWLTSKLYSGELWDAKRVGEMHEIEMPELANGVEKLMPEYEPHRMFARAIRGKATLETTGEVGLQALKVVDAVQRSAKEKHAISVG